MDWVITIAALLATWAAATIVGAERQQRLNVLASEAAAKPPADPQISAQTAQSDPPRRVAA